MTFLLVLVCQGWQSWVKNLTLLVILIEVEEGGIVCVIVLCDTSVQVFYLWETCHHIHRFAWGLIPSAFSAPLRSLLVLTFDIELMVMFGVCHQTSLSRLE